MTEEASTSPRPRWPALRIKPLETWSGLALLIALGACKTVELPTKGAFMALGALAVVATNQSTSWAKLGGWLGLGEATVVLAFLAMLGFSAWYAGKWGKRIDSVLEARMGFKK